MFLAVLTVFAHAEPTEPAAEITPASRPIKYLEREEIIFDGLDIEGEIVKPEVRILTGRTAVTFHPLIQLRKDWNNEMKASLDEIE